MRSKRITCDSVNVRSAGNVPVARRSVALLLAFATIFCGVISGCDHATAKAEKEDKQKPDTKQPPTEPSPSPTASDPEVEKPARLRRGEIPQEWLEPQRERAIPIDITRDQLDLTFDDLKFDIEIGQAFDRSLLSEKLKALDGKEITLSGFMRPSFKSSGLKGFIFVRDDKECCFGPQAAIYDCVRVYLAKGTSTNYLVRPFKVRGKFYLKEKEGPDGAIWSIFNMKNAKIEP